MFSMTARPTTRQVSPCFRRASQEVMPAGVVTEATAASGPSSTTLAFLSDSGTHGQSGRSALRQWAMSSPVETPRVRLLRSLSSMFRALPSSWSIPPSPRSWPRESSMFSASFSLVMFRASLAANRGMSIWARKAALSFFSMASAMAPSGFSGPDERQDASRPQVRASDASNRDLQFLRIGSSMQEMTFGRHTR